MKIFPLATVRSAVLNSPESYYLHLGGAQQGPYTIPQVDHLLNSGLIGAETLYWCDGLDQWQPVTSLVALRKKPKRWKKPVIAAVVVVLLAAILRVFGPVVAVGWKEANQHEFTENAAYWRARDVVRTGLRGQGVMVEFDALPAAHVTLADSSANAEISGVVTSRKDEGRRVTWTVPLKFDAANREWTGREFTELRRP